MNFWLNYHHLFYFKTIAEEGGVLKAAKKLRLGQPTLSAQLKSFENSIGVQLFERKGQRLHLTEHGKIALVYAKNVFQLGNEMFETLQGRKTSTKLHLKVGSLDSTPKQITLALVQQALKIAPCFVTLSEGKSGELLNRLATHEIDLWISDSLPESVKARGLRYRQISRRDVHIYGAKAFKFVRRKFPLSLEGQPLILPTFDSKLRSDLENWFHSRKISVDVLIESQDIAIKKLLAIDGFGLIPAGSHTVMRQLLAGELIDVGALEGVVDEIYLISTSRKIANPIAEKLMKAFSI